MTPAADGTRICPVAHYSLATPCSLPADHPDTWHETFHPDTGRPLRYRTLLGTRHTQEWEFDDDPAAPDAGQWVTWHYVTAETGPTPLVPEDLDQRVAVLLASHFLTGQAGTDDECACGVRYPAGGYYAHLGREASLLVRGYFDLGLGSGRGLSVPAN
ncbi:hypothetical protein [Streptomyces sp. NBC_01304]|uniref:hypothetical protein n=1 Tax=Streptomyces sp. NBC_01304 TaxID=2903818 RepID=UPI002E138196|nr:hypothetical protein OG430_48510 [Streptomyces sp. NBC_01304]